MRTLGGRIGLALLVFGLVTLVAVGGALWVVLRDLHRDAALSSLAELTVPYTAQARLRLLSLPGTLDSLREGPTARRSADEYLDFVEEAQAEIDAAGIRVVLVSENGTFVRDPQSGQVGRSDVALDIPPPGPPGVVQTGTVGPRGGGEALFAATAIRQTRRGDAPVLVLLREDDSAREAAADLVRALAVAAVLLLLIGIPLALWLGRSVARPLRRLASATADVAAGRVPEPLPLSGPLEVTEASAAFNAMAAEVAATRDAQRQLLADVRHDLRTPLTVISGFAQALRDGTARGETAARAAEAIGDEAGRLERMLQDLDQLAMPGAAGPPLRLQPLDSLALVQDAVERFTAEAESRGQAILVAPDAVRVTMVADRDALDRILGNLVANALAHAPAPGGRVSLEVTASAGQVSLSVRDDGPGIPAAAMAHVFDRFYRADAARTKGGSGLGLAIVRDLAEALGGIAFAESPPGGGARVGVRLPLRRAAGPARS